MAELFHMSVVTGEETLFDDYVEYANIPTGFGSVGILAGHAPMLCAVSKGVLHGTKEGEPFRVRIGTGVACVEKNELTVLVSDAKTSE